MKRIRIADATLCRDDNTFSFKEKIEIARQLEKLDCDVIELPEIQNARIDTLLIKTISTFVKKSTISVAAGMTNQSVENAAAALSTALYPRIRIELPTSPVIPFPSQVTKWYMPPNSLSQPVFIVCLTMLEMQSL